MMPIARWNCTMVVETVYGTCRTAKKNGNRKGRAKRPAEPFPLRATNVAARQGRLALPGACTKVKASHARHKGPFNFSASSRRRLRIVGFVRRPKASNQAAGVVRPSGSVRSSQAPVKPGQTRSKWVKVISTIIFLQLQDLKPDQSGQIRLNPTAAEDEAVGNVIALNMAGPKRPMRGTRAVLSLRLLTSAATFGGPRPAARVGRLASRADWSRNRPSEARVEDW